MTHDEALVWASEARRSRAELLDDLTSGRVTLSGAFDRAGADDHIGTMRVLSVLEAVPGASKVATRRALADLGVDERAPLASLEAAVLVERFGSPV